MCGDNTLRFADCGNGTVTDTATGLTWLKDAGGLGSLASGGVNYVQAVPLAGARASWVRCGRCAES
jgi:hypothetical protein